MQSVSSRIWTRVPVSIYYNDNQYTTGVLSIIINERKLLKESLSLKLNNKTENEIFSKLFVTTELTKYGLRKKTF